MRSLPSRDAEMLLDGLEAVLSPPAQERRASARYSYRRELKLSCPENNGPELAHWIFPRDISDGGIGFLHMEPERVGRAVTVHLLAQDGAVHAVPGRVVHCHALEGDWHLVGVCFENAIEALPYA
jgi:hypothetical protein